MKKGLSNTLELEAFAHIIGRAIGNVIIATNTAPPTSPEATKETVISLQETMAGAVENNAHQYSLAVYDGVMDIMLAYIAAGEIQKH